MANTDIPLQTIITNIGFKQDGFQHLLKNGYTNYSLYTTYKTIVYYR